MAYKNALVDDLTYQLKSIFSEANAGDQDARRWLCESFPAHIDLLSRHWRKRPDPAILKVLRRGASNEASRKLIERIAGRG